MKIYPEETFSTSLEGLDRQDSYEGVGPVRNPNRGKNKHNGRGKPKGHKKNKKLRGYHRA